MNDYFLQSADEQSMRTALIAAGVTDDEGNPTDGHAVSTIGTWYEQPSDPEAQPIAVPGWHVNVRSSSPVEWPESVTLHEPRTPWRVWG